MTRYIKAMAIWFFICFLATTFVLPLAGWSKNKIDLSQILINLLLWGLICYVVIYVEKRRIKRLNKQQ